MIMWRRALLAFTAIVPAGWAQAGEQPLYEAAPAWVVAAKLPDAGGPGSAGPMLFDAQQRIEGATVWSYFDTAIKLDTPEALSQHSDVTVAWLPDKGDLIIHELSIIRDGQTIDALAGGQRFTVLRREQALEQRELTGILSATLAVEGLRVGDVLRLRMTTTAKDAALGGRAQVSSPLVAEPARITAAHYLLSWRAADKARWKLLADKVEPKIERKGDFSEFAVAMPVPKQPEMPDDAPGRYQHPPIVEASTFVDWADVSRTMAPLYATSGTIADGSPLAAEVAAIKAATDDPLKRAAMALQIVQDKIRYLAVGMDGGNYVPQAPAKTWDVRYGDCKAKTLLLLALLHAMDIEAETVLAHAALGDIVPDRVPSALAFNHVLVRAEAGGDTLWLDGTDLGTRLADIRDTPALGHVLPVRSGGADLLKIALRPPARPLVDLAIDADESTSIDLPSVIDLTMVLRGKLASLLTLASAQLGEKERRSFIEQFLQSYVGEAQYESLTTASDADAGTLTIKGRGAFSTGWSRDERRMERWLSRIPDLLGFAPDRARPAWAAIPVATPAPDLAHYRLRIRLPDGGKDYAIEGEGALDTTVGGYSLNRTVDLADGIVTVEETLASSGIEIAASDVAAERDRFATMIARTPRLVAPADARRRWQLGTGERPGGTQMKAVEAIFDVAAAKADEENVTPLESAASFHRGIGDHAAAIEDYTRILAILPSVDAYLARAWAHQAVGDTAAALADAEAARKLDPSSAGAISAVATLTAEHGDVAKAVAMLDERIAIGGKERDDYRLEKANLLGTFGDARTALAEIDRMIEDKPGSPLLLNARCWIKATREIEVQSAIKDCTSAIELSDDTASILDSRALVWMRLGRNEDALRDLDAALLQAPDLGSSRFLRAIVLKQLGRPDEARRDLAAARGIAPSLEREYARYGLKP